jgi:PAS domain S-box-containing protein
MLGIKGEVIRWFGTCTDFEDQKQAEIDRKRSQDLLHMVIDRVPGLVSYLDSEVRYAFTNTHYADWFGAAPPIGMKAREFVGDAAFARAWPYIERAYAGEEVRFEELIPYERAEPRYVQICYSPHRAESGIVQGVVATIQDITVQKQMEEALRRSEERLQQVFAQAPVGVAVLRGRELLFELVNPSYQGFFPGRQLLHRPLAEAVPEVGVELLDIMHRILDTGEPFIGHEYLIALDRDNDGVPEDSWFTFVYQPLKDLDGTVAGIVVIAVDVGTHVRARLELERANRELEEFAYVASHDLQEPLRMVNVYTQLLLRRHVGDNPQAQEYAAVVHTGVKRMETLIHDLLTFSRTVHAQERPTESADLSSSLTEAMSVLKERIEESGARVIAPLLPTVQGDGAQIAHVFQNLLSNALKYQKEGSRPEIQITADSDGVNWTIAVRDNGIGFEPRYAERIFGLFKRLHKDEYPGTGLGLAICRRIVERHGGRIWAEGEPGQGSTFYISLPGSRENDKE